MRYIANIDLPEERIDSDKQYLVQVSETQIIHILHKTMITNQIDYVLINKRFENCIKSVKTYRGADISSDHIYALIVKIHIKHKRLI